MQTYEIINILLEASEGEAYLEVGVNLGITFYCVCCKDKVGIDPNIKITYDGMLGSLIKAKKHGIWEFVLPFKSDEFFEQISGESEIKLRDASGTEVADGYFNLTVPSKYDVIFIDGMHEYRQVIRDIENSMNVLSDNGFLVIHDTNPKSEKEAEPYYDGIDDGRAWTGDVWKALLAFQDYEYFTLDYGPGITVIPKQDIGFGNELPDGASGLSYRYFEDNREGILRMDSIERLEEYL